MVAMETSPEPSGFSSAVVQDSVRERLQMSPQHSHVPHVHLFIRRDAQDE